VADAGRFAGFLDPVAVTTGAAAAAACEPVAATPCPMLGLTEVDGVPRTTNGTRSVDEPRLHLLGYRGWTGAASATIIGAAPRATAWPSSAGSCRTADPRCLARSWVRELRLFGGPDEHGTVDSTTTATTRPVTPVELARRAVLAGCPPAGTVFDPFRGVGTIGRAAALDEGHRVPRGRAAPQAAGRADWGYRAPPGPRRPRQAARSSST
jgi:hypothetical protein